MSLFGKPEKDQVQENEEKPASLFSASLTNPQTTGGQPTTGGLFGAKPLTGQDQKTPAPLFGAKTEDKPNPFLPQATTAKGEQQTQSGGLFGKAMEQQKTPGLGFPSQTTTKGDQQQPTGGLLGKVSENKSQGLPTSSQSGGGLFGAKPLTGQDQKTPTPLFPAKTEEKSQPSNPFLPKEATAKGEQQTQLGGLFGKAMEQQKTTGFGFPSQTTAKGDQQPTGGLLGKTTEQKPLFPGISSSAEDKKTPSFSFGLGTSLKDKNESETPTSQNEERGGLFTASQTGALNLGTDQNKGKPLIEGAKPHGLFDNPLTKQTQQSLFTQSTAGGGLKLKTSGGEAPSQHQDSAKEGSMKRVKTSTPAKAKPAGILSGVSIESTPLTLGQNQTSNALGNLLPSMKDQKQTPVLGNLGKVSMEVSTSNKDNVQIKQKAKVQKTPQQINEEFKATTSKALAKENKIVQKINGIIAKLQENGKQAEKYMENRNEMIETIFTDMEYDLRIKISSLIEEHKEKMKKKIENEVKSFQTLNNQITKIFNDLVTQDSFAQILQSNYNINPNSAPPQNEESSKLLAKQHLAELFELQSGFTPLVKKYKVIKNNIPSLNTITEPFPQEFMTNETILRHSKLVEEEVQKAFAECESRLSFKIGSFHQILNPIIQVMEKYSKLKNTLLPLKPAANEPKVNNVQLSIYRPRSDETSYIEKIGLKQDDELEIGFKTQLISLHYNITEGDLIFYNGIPYEIRKKTWEDPLEKVELNNIFSGVKQEVSFDSKRWTELQHTILADKLLLVKPKNNKGFYHLLSLNDEKDTRSQYRVIKAHNASNESLDKRITETLQAKGRAIVRTSKIQDEEIIVSCTMLRSDADRK